MSKNLYVGNLSYETKDQDLRSMFSQYGNVSSAQVVMDRESGRSRGFGFVEMADGAQQAIEALNGSDVDGRALTVNEARPRAERSGSGGGGGYRGR